jgi:polyisoprenyl-teichoic acid--peptidoglycan teichoic acid transferase
MKKMGWKKHWLRNSTIVLGAVVVVAAMVVGGYLLSLSQAFNGTETIADAFPDDSLRPPRLTGAAADAQNILLLGSDTRGAVGQDMNAIRGQRSDTIMVVHVPADRKHVYAMSILRDSWVDIPGHGKAKINAALSWGGVPLAVQTIENLISARIDHVAIVDFQGFKGITDALGGVVVENAIRFTADGHTFPQGMQRLDGNRALTFVRERHAFADGDFQRARNQQEFIKAVVGTTLTAETMLDPGKMSSLVNSIAPFLKVDQGLDSAYVAGLGLQMRSVRSGDMTFFTAPTAGTGTSSDGQSIVNIDWNKLPTLQEAFRTDTLDAYQPKPQHMG